jgi:hypothetical protein
MTDPIHTRGRRLWGKIYKHARRKTPTASARGTLQNHI